MQNKLSRTLSPEEELILLLEAEAQNKAREDFLAFVRYVRKGYVVNFHHVVMAHHLQEWAYGRIKNLLIIMPPQHGKSEQVSRFLPAWLFGINPELSILAATYNADYATKNNYDVQNIMESSKYKAVFPDTILPGAGALKASTNKFKVKRDGKRFDVLASDHTGIHKAGSYLCAGVAGGLTGNPGKRIIVDDYFKDAKEAYSKAHRDAVWDWWATVVRTRMHSDSCVLITATQWHHDDLIGRLLKNDKNKNHWTVLRMEALKEKENHKEDPRKKGEALWPWRMDENHLKEIKNEVGEYKWNAMYQGRPTPDGGGIIKRSWFKYWVSLPEQMDEVVISADLNFKKTTDGSRAPIHVYGVRGSQIYLMDRVSGRWEFEETVKHFERICKLYPQAKRKYVEDKANGPALESRLKKKISGIILVPADTSKEARLRAIAHLPESGCVFLPIPARHPWVEEFLDEVCGFPGWPTDDDPDAFSHALIQIEAQRGNYVLKFRPKPAPTPEG